jgi:hypothetical protein
MSGTSVGESLMRRRTSPSARRAGLAALAMAAAALALDYTSRQPANGPPAAAGTAAFIHVRWAPGVDAQRRELLERRFNLSRAERTQGTTYSYLLTDTSTSNIRALVTEPDVADTHDVDRRAFTIADSAERLAVSSAPDRRYSVLAWAVRLLWAGAAGAALFALVALTARTAGRTAPRLTGTQARGLHAVANWLWSRIPEVSPEAAALFRIVFGMATLLVFAASPVSPADVPSQRLTTNATWLVRAVGNVFIATPDLTNYVGPWLWISGLLFIAGVLTRWSYAAFVAGAVAWGAVHSLQVGHHPFSALLIALVCLLPSRWGDAWSIDAWLRRRRLASAREYGYSVWIPGVVLGIALAAAATAKLREGGVGWILNGTVKYHFVTDAANAPVDWALRFALEPTTAIALSFGALAVESLVFPAAVVGTWIVRLLAGVAVIAMLAGFWFFQGVFWPGWWVLLLSFAPWHRLAPGPAKAGHYEHDAHGDEVGGNDRLRTSRLKPSHAQAAFLVFAVSQQIFVSARRIEAPPLFSAYDMYSKTYASPSEYPANGGLSYWLVGTTADGATPACQIGSDEARMFATPGDEEHASEVKQMVASCFGSDSPLQSIAIEQRHLKVDWTTGQYLGTSRVRIIDAIAPPR